MPPTPTQLNLVSIRFRRKISFVTSFTIFNWLKKYYISYCPDYPPLNSRRIKIKQVLNFFSAIGLIAQIKDIKQNIGETIVQSWYYEISIKIWRALLTNPHPNFVNLPPKFWCWFHKTNTVIYYSHIMAQNLCIKPECNRTFWFNLISVFK